MPRKRQCACPYFAPLPYAASPVSVPAGGPNVQGTASAGKVREKNSNSGKGYLFKGNVFDAKKAPASMAAALKVSLVHAPTFRNVSIVLHIAGTKSMGESENVFPDNRQERGSSV